MQLPGAVWPQVFHSAAYVKTLREDSALPSEKTVHVPLNSHTHINKIKT